VSKRSFAAVVNASLLLCLLLLEVGEDGFGGLAVGKVAGVDAEVGGLAVERFAGAVKFVHRAAGVGGAEERAFAVFDALVEQFGTGIEPNDGADLWQDGPVLLHSDDAASGRDDETDASDEALQNFGFEGSEMFLAVLLEDGRDGMTGLLRDECVGVDESESGERRQNAPYAGFAGSHESDENQIAKHVQIFTTFRALGPRSLGESSNSTVSPSSNVL